MSERPGFLTVSTSGSGLSTMNYEKKLMREKDVKFDGEDGSVELTDVRIVWIKKPSRWGAVKKVGAVAGAIGAAAVLDGIGREMGGVGGRALRRASWGFGAAAVGAAIHSWSADSYQNKDANGNTESVALPVIAISQATQSGNNLVVELKSGGTMQFHFKQKKVIPSVIANISSAQDKGLCPYCGANAGNAAACPKCGAPISGGGGGEPAGSGGGGGGFCTNCGQPMPDGARFCGSCGHKT
ncbi:MAG: zinc-ribbon domain-containing protein [Candidatus Thorarchaeota archaeon]